MMETATSDIRAVEFAPGSDSDSPVLPGQPDQIPECEPIRRNGRPWKVECPAAIARNETLPATQPCGRGFWEHWTGHYARSRTEAKMRCLKAFRDRIAAGDPDCQAAENQIRIAAMNRFSALGTAEIVRVA